MGQTFTHEALQAAIVLPDPITGALYAAHMKALKDESDGADFLVRMMRAGLVVIESGRYQDNGFEVDLKARGMEADLAVLLWMGNTVAESIAERLKVPKASSPPP